MLLRLAAKTGLALINAIEPRPDIRIERGVAFGKHPRQRLDVYATRKPGGAPVIVFFYGGGWTRGDRGSYAFVGRQLADAGFVAVIPDYRLHPEVRFPVFVEDAAAAVAWARAAALQQGGDPARLYAMGHSAGANIAALLALDSRYLARHGLVSRDLAGIIGLAGPYAFRHEEFPRYAPIFGGAGDAARPAKLVRRAPPPLLLMHGDADKTVSVEHTRVLAKAARGAGGRVVAHEYEGVGHAGLLSALSRRFRARAPAMADIERFVGEGRAEPAWRLQLAR